MLDLATRTAILRLRAEGHGTKRIARELRVSRASVKRVLASGEATVPPMRRPVALDEHVDKIRALHAICRGNWVRVHEELAAQGIVVGYSSLTRFCRHAGIGTVEKRRVGRYRFEPGEEMQHDTSPHRVVVGGTERRLECASVILCYSRLMYAQCFTRWRRFEVKAFLTEALQYLGGAASRAMLDNHSVVVVSGTGPSAVMAPEMEAFSERFGFDFVAHEKGDVNRSARVERPFDFIEKNFYPGRTFDDLDDLNAQFRTWCDTKNAAFRRGLGFRPRELWAAERPLLKPLPLHIPEVYAPHDRRVDTEGYVSLHRNRYSMPEQSIGRQVVVHEHRRSVKVFDGHRLVVEHAKRPDGAQIRVTLPEHRYQRRRTAPAASPQEGILRAASPVLGTMADALRKRHGGQAIRAMRRLHTLYLDYPTEPLVAAVETALEFGLLDLQRLEAMVLQRVRGDFFRLPSPNAEEAARGRRSRTVADQPEAEEAAGAAPRDPGEG